MIRNRFQILEEGDGYVESFRRYQQYLKQLDRTHHPDLWWYFRRAFFHDSLISALKFSDDLETLSFVLCCENIRPRSDELFQRQGYCPVEFQCTVWPLIWFQLDVEEDDEPSFSRELYFYDCEINTLVDKFQPKQEDEVYGSLIISVSGIRKYLSIVFSGITVRPAEMATFYQMLISGQYEIPMFEPDDILNA